ncbi:MAG: MarR family winged helix-turn-helix transcriptional regulator [Lapillicoccus sp.]
MSAAPGAGDDDRDLPLLLRRASEAVDALVLEGLARRGHEDVRMPGLHILRRSRGHWGLPISSLAEHLGVSAQAASKIVKTLVAKDLMLTCPHPGDGRAVLAQPTWEGLRVIEAADGAIEDGLDALGDEVDAAELSRCVRTLRAWTHDPGQWWPGPGRPVW